jgi:hypothetical protein
MTGKLVALIAPNGTKAATIGANQYKANVDGLFHVQPEDVGPLIASGTFTVAPPEWTPSRTTASLEEIAELVHLLPEGGAKEMLLVALDLVVQ